MIINIFVVVLERYLLRWAYCRSYILKVDHFFLLFKSNLCWSTANTIWTFWQKEIVLVNSFVLQVLSQINNQRISILLSITWLALFYRGLYGLCLERLRLFSRIACFTLADNLTSPREVVINFWLWMFSLSPCKSRLLQKAVEFCWKTLASLIEFSS